MTTQTTVYTVFKRHMNLQCHKVATISQSLATSHRSKMRTEKHKHNTYDGFNYCFSRHCHRTRVRGHRFLNLVTTNIHHTPTTLNLITSNDVNVILVYKRPTVTLVAHLQ